MRTEFIRKFYDTGYDQYGNPINVPNVSVGGSTASGALSGAALGTSIVPGWGTLVGGVIGAGYGLFSGISQKNKANKILANNPYPVYNPPPEIIANQQAAQQRSLQGLPSQQYNTAMKNIQRNQQAALLGSQNRRSGIGSVGAIQQQSNDALQGLTTQDVAAQKQNQQALYGINNQVAQYRDKAFDWNERNKYQQNYSYAMNLLGAGNQNITRGVDAGVSAIIRSGLFGSNKSNPNVGGNATPRPAGWFGSDSFSGDGGSSFNLNSD